MAGAVARGDVRFYRFQAADKQRPVLVLSETALSGTCRRSRSRRSRPPSAEYHPRFSSARRME